MLLLSALMFSACAPVVSPTTDAPAPTAAIETQSDAPSTEATENTTDSSAETRLVVHALGETEVPVNPQRVVILDPYGTLQTALDLDVPVVAAPHFQSDAPFVKFLAPEQVADIADIGWFNAINLEAVLLAEPDLIVGWSTWVEPIYAELSSIAPTVGIQRSATGDWKAVVRATAEAFGKSDEVEAQFAAYDQRIADFQEAMGDQLATLEVGVLRAGIEEIRIYTPYFYSGQIVAETGLQRPANHVPEDVTVGNIPLSLELLPEVDADVLILFPGGGSDPLAEVERTLAVYRENPIWDQLRAVQNDKIHIVDADHWFSGGGLLSANLILDDLFRIFVEQE